MLKHSDATTFNAHVRKCRFSQGDVIHGRKGHTRSGVLTFAQDFVLLIRAVLGWPKTSQWNRTREVWSAAGRMIIITYILQPVRQLTHNCRTYRRYGCTIRMRHVYQL